MSSDGRRAELRLIEILTRYQIMIQAYAHAIVQDFQLAEDVYQEVGVHIVSHPDDVPVGPGLEPWLREVTRRKSLEVRRRSRRIQPLLSDEALEAIAPSFAPPNREGQDLRDRLIDCTKKLQTSARAVIHARYAENLACDEIARRTQLSIQSVYAILKRAKVALHECVERGLAAEHGGAT